MTGRLAGRTAIVTGASRGLGRATALALAAEGAAVAVVARTQQQWDERLPGTIGETVAAIEAAGGRAVAIAADLLERDDIPRVWFRRLGPRSGRSPSWSTTRPSPHPDVRRGRTRHPRRPSRRAPRRRPTPTGPASSPFRCRPTGGTSRSAVFASYELIQLVCPDMFDAGFGSIINVTSVASRVAGDGPYHDFAGGVLPGYGGAKAALEHLDLLCRLRSCSAATSPSTRWRRRGRSRRRACRTTQRVRQCLA